MTDYEIQNEAKMFAQKFEDGDLNRNAYYVMHPAVAKEIYNILYVYPKNLYPKIRYNKDSKCAPNIAMNVSNVNLCTMNFNPSQTHH